MDEVPSFRPRRADDLGLRRALSDRLLPALVAAMVFLAALALAGAIAAHGLASHWRGDAAAMLTIQVPEPDQSAGGASRAAAVAAALQSSPGASGIHRLAADELALVLKPWLGEDVERLSIKLPAVFEVQAASPAVAAALSARLSVVAPGTLVEANGVWYDRLTALAGSLELCAAVALGLVVFVAAAVVAVATRAGIAARRDAIEIVHGLGATDGMIAGRFAGRLTVLTFAGALVGAGLALPMLLGLASLAVPFQADAQAGMRLPSALWVALPVLPVAAGVIGWLTAQATVRSWLARLP